MKVVGAIPWLTACAVAGVAMSKVPSADSISSVSFGTVPGGRPVELYSLRNSRGMEATIATYGGIVVSLTAPDRKGKFADVVLGFDTLEEYIKSSPYFGALVGRYGNRIAHGRFSLEGKKYQLATNDGPNSLHGGTVGFDKVVWTVTHSGVGPLGPQLTLTYQSRDGEEGYPGNLSVTATYTLLTEKNALRINYSAVTDQPTVVNLTHHSYFNLRGGEGDVLAYTVQIHADYFTPVDATLIPTGERRSVVGTPFDFRLPRSIGDRIGERDEQLQFARGYDHNWIMDYPYSGPSRERSVRVNATVSDPQSGRVLQVSSSEPGLQFYTGNFLDGSLHGKGGRTYGFRSGFCLEPQHFPDSPNHPEFPSTVLKPGETYHSTLLYSFAVN
jgi:aldose 1-epimerase